jgi:Domain of unknown function (DUF222)/HNH endonuclease
MLSRALKRVAEDLRSALSKFEPERLSGPDAAMLLELFAGIEKLAAGGKLLAARRVESSNVWRRQGHRSAAAQVAEATGSGLGPAITALEAARQLGSLPATDEAMRDGRLSEAQVKEITSAAIHQPGAEQELVDAAEKQPLNVLKLRCRRVKATGRGHRDRYEAIRRGRYLRHWTDPEGAVRLDARLTPDDGARVVAAVKAHTDLLADEARNAGRTESHNALAADALVSLAQCTSGGDTLPARKLARSREIPSGPSTMIHVRVDHDALRRGHTESGEICEIPGIGPIPVEVANRLASDSILSVLVTDGVDVTAVAHAGRTIPASIRRALIERDQLCVVPGCEVRDHLEIDHVEPLGRGGPTSLSNLARLCRWHHYLKTYQRHRLERCSGGWRWVAPSQPATGNAKPRPG